MTQSSFHNLTLNLADCLVVAGASYPLTKLRTVGKLLLPLNDGKMSDDTVKHTVKHLKKDQETKEVKGWVFSGDFSVGPQHSLVPFPELLGSGGYFGK